MDTTVPEIRISQPCLKRNPAQPRNRPRPAAPVAHSEVRRYLLSRGNSAFADRLFKLLMLLCALSIFMIVALIAYQLIDKSQLNWAQSGFKFFYTAI